MALRTPAFKAPKPFATATKKNNFSTRFAEIVRDNITLNERYTIQFFDTPAASNYVINGLDGKSINVTQLLSDDEMDAYRVLKQEWYNS
jgi:hypothetical protein